MHPALNAFVVVSLLVPMEACLLPVLADEDPPETLELIGVIRDFKERTVQGGHPDFERRPDGGFGHFAGNVDVQLGDDGKPVYTGEGYYVRRQWRDSQEGPSVGPCTIDPWGITVVAREARTVVVSIRANPSSSGIATFRASISPSRLH